MSNLPPRNQIVDGIVELGEQFMPGLDGYTFEVNSETAEEIIRLLTAILGDAYYAEAQEVFAGEFEEVLTAWFGPEEEK